MFREWILLLASSLTAGYSMENALVQSYQELCMMFPKGGIMQEELKIYPFGDVWNYFCEVNGVPERENWFQEVKRYEEDVLSKRN